jgi:hypothetical protein
MRAELAAAGIKGKRLTYRQPHKQGQIDVRLALLWQIFAADERDGIPKSVFQ